MNKQDIKSDLKRYMRTFGDVAGAKYLADGLTYTDALLQQVKKSTAEREDLLQRCLALGIDPDKKEKGMSSVIRMLK